MSPLPEWDPRTPARIVESMHRREHDLAAVQRWLHDCRQHAYTQVERIDLAELDGWYTDPATGDIRHRVGKFFAITGLSVDLPAGPVPHWHQPIIIQPEVGILGILVKRFDGVLHCLMQAKVEPGNSNGLQLSPTVQATRSNYTRVHGGKPVPYLEYFVDTSGSLVLADVRQSEQGSWFHQKRNRNMVIEVAGDVEVLDGFRWLTLGDVHRLLAVDDLVNMDTRTVLSCLPFAGPRRSLHPMSSILSWITELRTRTEITTRMIPLNSVRGWHRDQARIWHDTGSFFDVIGIDVLAGGREVGHWTQPMLHPHGTGIVAFLMRDIGGVPHVLTHARVEPGFVDVIELAPTVQCAPENYAWLPPAARPPFLDEVLTASPDQIRFNSVLSEEGGRFYHARNVYRVVRTDLDPADEPPDFRWVSLPQLVELLRHSHYVNVQARTMIACLRSMEYS